MIKASTTQTVITMCSGESTCYAMVRGPTTALSMKSMARDYGHEIKVALETGSVSGRGMSLRLVCREGATRGYFVFVVQGFSTSEKRPSGKSQESAMKQT